MTKFTHTHQSREQVSSSILINYYFGFSRIRRIFLLINTHNRPTTHIHRRRLCLGNRELCPVFTEEPEQTSLFAPVPLGAYFFYRATLCARAVFAVARCLPVCHVGGLYPNGWRYRQTSFRPGSPIILVFLTPSSGTQFKGEPLQQGAKYTKEGKFCNFQLKSRFISETVRDRPVVAVER